MQDITSHITPSNSPAPALKSSGAWGLNKLASVIDPENVQDGGNQMNHGVWTGGATVESNDGDSMRIRALDAVNMCPMTKSYPFGNPLPAGSDGLKQLRPGSIFGMGSNIYNNLWNTNYPLYYPYYDPAYCTSPTECKNANAKFRYVLEL